MRTPKFLRVLTALCAILVAFSCTGDTPTTPTPVAAAPEINPELLGDLLGDEGLVSGTTRLVGSLLTCTPQPFQAAQAVIGPNGGTISLGPNSLYVPRGALSRNVTIRAEYPSDDVASIRFYPEGLTFAKPAVLTLSYSHCNLVAGLLTPKRIAYTTERLRILEFVPTFDNVLQRKVHGQLEHFSRYAVSW